MKLSFTNIKNKIVHFFTAGSWITRPVVYVPVAAAVVAAGLFLTLNATKFKSLGFLEQEGYAISDSSIVSLLSENNDGASLTLTKVNQGEELISSVLSSKEYFVGENELGILSGYPIYTRQGQVMYFVDNEMNLISEDWDTYESYLGLYLSDGTTYNNDGSVADEDIMLVGVSGGFLLGEKAILELNEKTFELPMNSFCGFLEDQIVFFEYTNGRLDGYSTNVTDDTMITIGDMSLTYQQFRENLGLWKAQAEIPKVEEPEEEEEEEEKEKEIIEDDDNAASNTNTAGSPSGGGSSGSKSSGGKKKGSNTSVEKKNPNAETVKKPEAAKPSANATPVAPTSTNLDTDPTYPDYSKPEVTIGDKIDAWVYTLSIDVQVNDPADRIQNGIKVSAYEILSSGKEKLALRKTVGGSGTVDLGQLEPGVQYHLTASYTYKDELNKSKTVNIEIGKAKTTTFSALSAISLSFYGEESQSSYIGAVPVEIFSNSIQIRNICFDSISNGKVIEGSDKVTTHTNLPIKQTETYVNDFILTAVNRSDSSVTVTKMDSSSLRRLKEGYTVYSWNSAQTLTSGCEYSYTIQLQDRYGNIFKTSGVTMDGGHTCKEMPTVSIVVPDKTNIAGQTEIDVTWRNKDLASVSSNTEANACMGDTVAALFIVPANKELSVENAIELDGYIKGHVNNKTTGTKFLPIEYQISKSGDTATTRWVITNLPTSETYKAGVIVGTVDILDNQIHHDEIIDDTINFMTASLATLGTISYTTEISNITMTGCDLSFRMNKANSILLPLLDSVTLKLTGNNETQTVTFYKDELQNVSINGALSYSTETSLYGGSVTGVPVHVGTDTNISGTTTVKFSGQIIPSTDGGNTYPENLWDYLIATSYSSNKDNCYLQITVGDELVVPEGSAKKYLIKTQPSTQYDGYFVTIAKQGGVEYDISNYSGVSISFKTKSEKAKVCFDNALAFDTFIELYNLTVEDPGNAIVNDGSNSQGDIVIQILDSHNLIVTSTYMYSSDTYKSMHIDGLEINKTYTMVVKALVYQEDQLTEKMYALEYENPQDAENPTIYTFTTGENVSGDISLLGVSQLYDDDVGGTTDNLTILEDSDFYYGYFTSGNKIYYYGGEDGKDQTKLQEYRNIAQETELYDETKYYAYNQDSSASTSEDYRDGKRWTTRLISCSPGDQYVIYNTEYDGSACVTFYYVTSNGQLSYYTQYSARYLNRGGAFVVPSPDMGYSPTSSQIRYMRISGNNLHNSSSMILEKYDSTKTQKRTNLAKDVTFTTGLYLSGGNSVSTSVTRAYTSEYIPVTSGSVYEICGRDPNIPDIYGLKCTNYSCNNIYFYASDYTFLGSYEIRNQVALIKAPFGACYCRFNINLQQDTSTGQYILNTDDLSLKLYREAIQNKYIVRLKTVLKDNSDLQILRNGEYRINLYISDRSADDNEDLTLLNYSSYGDSKVFSVTDADMPGGKLNISSILTMENLPANMAYKAELEIIPSDWNTDAVLMDTVYFTTNRTTYTIANAQDYYAIKDDPSGNYIVVDDFTVSGSALGSDRPFTGTIDFQGHTITQTSSSPIFYTISKKGTLKNLVLYYIPTNHNSYSYWSNETICDSNYGTIQNIIINYGPDNEPYQIEYYYSGGITWYNYGTIDGFIFRFTRDVRVSCYFGAITYGNYGTVSNGYVCSNEVQDEDGSTHYARLIHTYALNEDGSVFFSNGQATRITYGIAANYSRATMKNVFILGDLIIESADATSETANADIDSSHDNSALNTAYDALLISRNDGTVDGCFTVGDRIDTDPNGNSAYMISRGPAITVIGGTYNISNVTYFSNSYASYNQTLDTLAKYNIKGDFKNLYDYQWYDNYLGEDGDRFRIRDVVEAGYYPTLIFPECMPSDEQPLIDLPGKSSDAVKVLSNEVRVQGTTEALVTITLDFPGADYGYTVNDFLIKAEGDSEQLEVEILKQEDTAEGYRVDILLTYPDSGKAKAVSKYLITTVSYTGNNDVTLETETGANIIAATFWRPISSVVEWSTLITNSGASENYWVTADLDFSQSTTWRDWFVRGDFYGHLNGGIYEETTVQLTDYNGNTILDTAGYPRAISAWGDLTGLRTISGVGNLITDSEGNQSYYSGRDNSSWCSCLMNHAVGAIIENFVFRDFVSTSDCGQKSSVYSDGCGVIRYTASNTILRNLHVRDSNMYTYAWGGALVARFTSGTVENCSARNCTITKLRFNDDTSTIYLGGLLGGAEYATVSGCFAADVSVLAQDVYASSGMGGLIGYMYASNVSSCYATGTVNGMTTYLGGIAGYMSGDGTLEGCWSNVDIQTVSDYAGGIVGYHGSGVLANNYTSSMVITRSLDASYVHRICNTTAFSETTRYNNYAFKEQYLTYVNPNPTGDEGVYQFGTWDELDGASGLLDYDTIANASTWENIIEIGSLFDLNSEGITSSISGGTNKTSVSQGYFPKLLCADGTTLLYDQPDIKLLGENAFNMRAYYVGTPSIYEDFMVRIVVTSDTFSNYLNTKYTEEEFNQFADWSNLSIIGGQIKANSLKDLGDYVDSNGNKGHAFQFTLQYGSHATDGHYLDSYIMSLPIWNPDTEKYETILTRISLQDQAVYKQINSIEEWDEFFSQSKYATAYENIMIGWLSNEYPNRGKIDFSEATTYSNSHSGAHVYNVRVNRICGAKDSSTGQYPSLCNWNVTIKASSKSLICSVITSVNDIDFDNLYIDSTGYGGYKGVIGDCMGNLTNVNFTDITLLGGSGGYMGCVGRLTGEASDIYLEDIRIETNGYYIGGFVGYARDSSTIHDVHMTASDEQFTTNSTYNVIDAKNYYYVGGLIGRSDGICYNLSVERTHVKGRYMVGGVIGYTTNNGGRPDSYKLENVVCGNENEVSDTPGNVGKPNVIVELHYDDNLNGSRMYAGGVVGYGDGYRMTNLKAYNVKVCMLTDNVSGKDSISTEAGDINDDLSLIQRYYHYVGGLVGHGGGNITDSMTKNCTVVSFGGWIGGLSGGDLGQDNISKDNVVIGLGDDSSEVGGVSGGCGSIYRCTAEHCVVIGSDYVGGLVGKCNYYLREDGVIDCVVIGKNYVGGLAGWSKYNQQYSDYVSATMDSDGNPTVTTTLTAAMLEPATSVSGHSSMIDKLVGKTYSGTYISGSEGVGGLFGRCDTRIVQNSYVSKGVTVEGENSVGGLAGRYFAWAYFTYVNYDREIDNCASGATVIGKNYVGGLIGQYTVGPTTAAYPEVTNNTGKGLSTGSFNGLLMTGNVEGEDSGTCHLIVGGYTMNSADNGVDENLNYCRIYENSTLKVGSTTQYAKNIYTISYDYVKSLPISSTETTDRSAYVSKLLTLSANNLSDTNVYFAERSARYMGMAWGYTYWSDEALLQLYKQSSAPATFSQYSSGIKQTNLVLWYDARNNTGYGYTDKDATVWKDLSNSHNDATLVWANKVNGEAVSITEHNSYMRWNNGALEFTNPSTAYYAQIAESISPYLQENYTVELIYEFTHPDLQSSAGSVLSWYSKSYLGGFRCPFGSTNYTQHYIYYDLNAAQNGTLYYNIKNQSGNFNTQRYRTATYVVSAKDTSGKMTVSYYIDGTLDVTNNDATFAFRNTDDITWRIGAYSASNSTNGNKNGYIRVLGVRVYDKALTEDEVTRNSTYDQWYYFGGSKPADLILNASASFTLDADGTVSGTYEEPLALVRSDDGNYNGTLVTDSFTSGTPLSSTGYYYCVDNNGKFSNVVCIEKGSYGPYLLSQNLNSEYYGMYKNRNVAYQEGTDGDVNDYSYTGGYWLPTSQKISRNRTVLTSIKPLMSMLGLFKNTVPEFICYASGADSLNIELLSDATGELNYEIETEDGVVLSGEWPSDSRTITVSYDFVTDFTCTIYDENNEQSSSYTGADLCKTVMTYGTDYWYLKNNDCYSSSNKIVGTDIVHIMNGMGLGSDGLLYSLSTDECVGQVNSFELYTSIPLWSGTISDQSLLTFGSYCTYGGTIKDQPIIVRNGLVHTIPRNDVVYGSYITDDYSGSQYTVYLTTGGSLVCAEDPIVFPEEFGNSGIKEISCSNNYSGHVVLVRYNSGNLVAFDYLTGEVLSTESEAEEQSFFSFLKESLLSGSDHSMWSNGSDDTSASEYQEEVETVPGLKEALQQFGNTTDGESEADGESETGITSNNQQASIESTLEGEEGTGGEEITDAPEGVEGDEDGILGDTLQDAATGDASSMPLVGTTKERDGEAKEKGIHTGKSGTLNEDAEESDDESEEKDSSEKKKSDKTNSDEEKISSEYVKVYDSETGETRIYELKEYLEKSGEEMVSEEEKAEELEKLGFVTSLFGKLSSGSLEVSGMVFMVCTMVVAIGLIALMAYLKKRKFESQ